MKQYPNQRTITIRHREDETALYSKIYINDAMAAAKNLGGAAFKLWVYFSTNRDGYTFALSKVDVQEKIGISKNSYFRVIEELEQKGYLRSGGDNHLVFNGYTHNGSYSLSNIPIMDILSTHYEDNTVPIKETRCTQERDRNIINNIIIKQDITTPLSDDDLIDTLLGLYQVDKKYFRQTKDYIFSKVSDVMPLVSFDDFLSIWINQYQDLNVSNLAGCLQIIQETIKAIRVEVESASA